MISLTYLLVASVAGVSALSVPSTTPTHDDASAVTRSGLVGVLPSYLESAFVDVWELAVERWNPSLHDMLSAKQQPLLTIDPEPSPDRLPGKSTLFPITTIHSFWTTFPSISGYRTLTNALFRPHNDNGMPHNIVTAPSSTTSTKAMMASYAKGSYTLTHGWPSGFSFYAPGPADVVLTTAKEATFGYRVYFPPGFDWVKGGKLPGLYGGDTEAEAIGCSGGRRDNGCFSVRFMWRTNGAGEFYTYLPPDYPANNKVCTVPPFSTCNPTYGASVGRGSFKFATGTWTTITQRVRLNDAGKANGQIELFANGVSVVNVSGLQLRDSSAGRIRGMIMQTFFGGSSVDYASSKNQKVYFRDFSVGITQLL